jgi:hypothetical protein
VSTSVPNEHTWTFAQRGGLNQVVLGSAADLEALEHLDQKLWVALSCPVNGLEIDARTLALIDTDADGHIRPPEVIAAVKWACARLRKPESLLEGGAVLPLDAIGDGPGGLGLAEAAAWVLARLERTGTSVTAADASKVEKAVSEGPLKGDGVIRPEAATDAPTRGLIEDIAACCGTVTAKSVEGFYSDLAAFRAWSESGGSANAAGLGPAAAEAFAAVAAVRAKVDDYFMRVHLAEFDPAAAAGLNRTEADYRAVSAKDLSEPSSEVAALPLARIEPGRALPLVDGVNPAWAAAIARFREAAVLPLLGSGLTALAPADWAALAARLRPYEAWIGTKPATGVARLGIERARVILSGEGRAGLDDLLSRDRELAPRVAAAADIERLALFYRDLGYLLRNFVNFSDFYSRTRPALFQAGTLYLDSRSCRLCVKVDDVAAHAPFAVMSRVYVTYLQCRRAGGETQTIAAGFTQGDSDYLFVGRNGVFYDWQGRDWHATIVRIAESPISVREAFFAPYKKVAAFVEEQFTRFAGSKAGSAEASLTSAAAAVPAAPAAPAAQPPSFDIAKFAGIFAALGLACAAIGGVVASAVSGLLRLPRYEIPIAIAAALLAISGPSMILAALKLRQRNLGPLLEGTGWAVNGRVKINLPLGIALTDRAVLPPNSSRLAHDPYANVARNRRWLLALAAVLMALVWLLVWAVFGALRS